MWSTLFRHETDTKYWGQCTKIFKYIYDALKKVVLSSVKSSAYWILKKMEEASDEIQKHMEVSWDETIIQAIKQ